MNIFELIDKYPVMFTGVTGAICGAISSLTGVFLTSYLNLKAKNKDAENSQKLKLLENSIDFQKRHIIEPAMLFLESELKLLSLIYEDGLTKNKSPSTSEQSDHIRLLAMTEARIKTLDDKIIEEKFRKFTHKRIKTGNKIYSEYHTDLNAAYDEIQEAITLASEIMILLKRKLRTIEEH